MKVVLQDEESWEEVQSRSDPRTSQPTTPSRFRPHLATYMYAPLSYTQYCECSLLERLDQTVQEYTTAVDHKHYSYSVDINTLDYRGREQLNTNEKALLPFLRHHMRPPNNRIRTTNPDPLHRRRTPQTQHLLNTPLLPRRLQRIPDGEEDARSHEQGRLAHPARTLDGAQVLPVDVFQQADVEFLGYVAETGDLWPYQLLSHESQRQGVHESLPYTPPAPS